MINRFQYLDLCNSHASTSRAIISRFLAIPLLLAILS